MMRPAPNPAIDGSIDLARAGLMLYVVGYLHLGGYVGDGQSHVGWASVAITQGALGTFTFISGYLLARRPLQMRLASWFAFYRQRWLRIYPLYLVALAWFTWAGLTDWRTAAKAAVGLTMLAPPSPMTLWYVAMLLFCIAVTPLLMMGSRAAMLVTSLGLLTALAAWHLAVGPVDLRLATQFSAFASGVLVARSDWRHVRIGGALLLASAMAVALQLGTTDQGDLSNWTAIPAVCLVPLLTLRALDALPPHIARSRLVHALSYGSFCAYLFHRLLYAAFEQIWPLRQPLHHWLGLLGIALPAILLFAFAAQTLYDRLLSRPAGSRTFTS